jgi:hypothetical protein
MDRRQFIRVAGGGAIFAASAVTTGCADAMPADAIADWRGPGAEADLRRWALGYAILAPHSHNLQSWRVDLSVADEVLLRCDLQRLLPQTDPYSRQIMMSHGTFIELLDLAARERGHRTEVTLFPEGAFGPRQLDGRPVARIRFVADPALPKDPLFAQILKRRTNRKAYDLSRPVAAPAWAAMAEAVKPHPMRFGFVGTDHPEMLRQQRAVAAEAWRIELVTPRTVMESYKVLRVGAGEIAQHRDGLSMLDAKVVWLNRLGLFDRSQAPGPQDYATTSQIAQFNSALESTPGFLWLVSDDNERATQVAAGRAYARAQLAATAHGVVMQPLSQALQEYPEQQRPYAQIHGLLQAAPPAQTVQMWARVGHADPVEPAPRRGVKAIIAKA